MLSEDEIDRDARREKKSRASIGNKIDELAIYSAAFALAYTTMKRTRDDEPEQNPAKRTRDFADDAFFELTHTYSTTEWDEIMDYDGDVPDFLFDVNLSPEEYRFWYGGSE